jgi:hypothetical protein
MACEMLLIRNQRKTNREWTQSKTANGHELTRMEGLNDENELQMVVHGPRKKMSGLQKSTRAAFK